LLRQARLGNLQKPLGVVEVPAQTWTIVLIQVEKPASTRDWIARV
jgi:hypothetical protein